MTENFSMIVLAGGKSSRMGTDKADLELEGKTFLQLQIDKGRALGITDIQVSGYRGNLCDIPVTPDRFPGKGPLGGLESCLRNARHEKCLVLGVDNPLVPVSELEKLLRFSGESGKPVTILKAGQREQPLIAVYHRDLADAMLEEIQKSRGSVFGFLNRIGYGIFESDKSEAFFVNINCPKDYHEIK